MQGKLVCFVARWDWIQFAKRQRGFVAAEIK